jgi:para-nitrobenzyl esterase
MLLGGEPTAADWALSRRMVAAWAGFAANGDPGWPPVTAQATPVRIWDTADRLEADTRAGTRQAWSGYTYAPVEL